MVVALQQITVTVCRAAQCAVRALRLDDGLLYLQRALQSLHSS